MRLIWLSRSTDARPVEPRRHLLDMRRFAGAVVAVTERAGYARSRRGSQASSACRTDSRVEVRDMLTRLGKTGHFQIAVDPE